MKVLVTGGAGYLGSVLCRRLLEAGHQVTALDNFMYNQSSLLDCCGFDRFEVIRGDARDKDLVLKHLKAADVIIPLACYTGAPLCSQKPIEARSVIVDAVRLILENKSPDQMVIYPTTNSGYGIGDKEACCTEESPLRPVSLYGKLKVEIENAILETGNCISLRLATVFGVRPRMRLDLLVNDFTWRAVTDRFIILFEAHFRRNYVHITDIARAFMYCTENYEKMKGQAYNVGLSDANLTKRQLCEEIKKQVPDFYFTEAEVGEDPDKRDYLVSNAKIEATGFKAKVSLGEGIKELIKGYQVLRQGHFSNV